jgi:hypothetical protein
MGNPMFGFLRRSQSVTKIALTPPASLPGRTGLCVVLIVRNEAAHIAEWARFHLQAGAAGFIVYDNGCTDGTIAALRAEVDAIVIPWDQKLRDARRGLELHNQVLAYAHAVRNFGGRYRWMTFIDVDEFLVPATDLPTELAALDHCTSISLPWHMFGRSGHMTPPPGGVVPNYTRRNPDPMSDQKGLRNWKMIVDPCAVTAIKVHEVWAPGDRTWNVAGQAATLSTRDARGFYAADRIQLNHYYTRSDAELRAKIARGPNLTTPDADHLRRVMRKVDAIEAAEVEDRRAAEWVARWA